MSHLLLSFEIYDITKGQRLLPYNSGYFDLVHMRSIHTGVRDAVTPRSICGD